ncbi:diguanylate cyclase domain-containing protein [Tundrisphaera lichenicola]|uniref:diguanylate cyclase domain-containing protein n=1 Tax=Tundrisphaera lichenicola TaxID=2029860 RepID=UPI003EB7E517
MPNIVETRSSPSAFRPAFTAPSPSRRDLATSRSGAFAWVRAMVPGFGRTAPGDPALEAFALLSASARDPEEIRVALVRLASEISGAPRVELIRDRAGAQPRRLAVWPTCPHLDPIADSGSMPRGPFRRMLQQVREGRALSRALSLTLKSGETSFGSLRLTLPVTRPWRAGAESRLRALCAIAATAERALSASASARPDPERRGDPELGPQGSVILTAFLGFAHAQARRRREPLSLLEVTVDRLSALRELLGDELAELAIDRVARAARSTVRSSDVLTRLEDGRLAVILPNASAENAMRVAEAIRQAIARSGAASTTMPALTASIGLANFPDHATDVPTLRAAAANALTRAEAEGHDRIATAPALHPALDREQLAG